jgi:MFS family permease
VLIGLALAERGLSDAAVGAVLASLLAGIAFLSVLIARYGDRVGRRRCYRLLFVGMAVAGAVFALTGWLPALLVAGLTGTVSTDVVESGPFTSLEQAMLPHAAGERDPTRLFGTLSFLRLRSRGRSERAARLPGGGGNDDAAGGGEQGDDHDRGAW